MALSAEAFALVLCGALLHALWNLQAKRASGGLPFVWLYGLVSLVAAMPLIALLLWRDPSQWPGVSGWSVIAASAAVHVLYGLVLQKGYRASDFSIVYPLARGTGPLFSVLAAVLILGELPGLIGASGIALLLAGIVLVSGLVPLRARSPAQRRGLLWGGLTGLCIAIYTLIDAWAVKRIGMSPVLYYCLSLGVRTVLLAPLAARHAAAVRTQWLAFRGPVLAVGLLSPVAYMLVLTAMVIAPLSYVAPLRELSMLLGVWLGARVLRETLSPLRLAGTLCMLAGVAALACAR